MTRKPKRADVVPGAVLAVRLNHELMLNGHLYLMGEAKLMPSGKRLTIITKPRRDKDGINLVRVKVDEVNEYECFYIDVLNHCEITT